MRTDRRLQRLLQTQRELMSKELWLYSRCRALGRHSHRIGVVLFPSHTPCFLSTLMHVL